MPTPSIIRSRFHHQLLRQLHVTTSPETNVPTTARRDPTFHMRRPPLPLPRPPHPRPHHHLHRPHHQAPTLLPRPPLPPLPAQMPPHLLTPKRHHHHLSTSARTESPPSDPVSTIYKVVDDLFASDGNMEAVLDQCGVDLTSGLVVDVLDRFRHAHRPAYRFFRWAGKSPGFGHDSETYNKMLSVLGRTRQFETMVVVLEEMRKAGVLNMESFRTSVAAFAAAREMKKAVGALGMMERCGFDVGIDVFNGFLEVLVKENLAKEAHQLFERMRGRWGYDLRTYTVVLSGWCKVKNLVEAGRVWNEMVDAGLRPDVVAHNVMIEGLIRGQRRPEAIKLFELMKAKGPRPEVCTYNILIRDFCKHGKMENAMGCFQEMLDDGVVPDVVMYTSLITGFGHAKRMDEVSGLLKEMEVNGCPADGKTYSVLIKIMANNDRLEDVERIYKRMIKNGVAPTIHTFNMMMKCYFRMNDFEMGCDVWEEMRRMGVCPDDNSYTVLIGGLIRYGRSEEALRYMEEMINKGMKAPRFDYSKFVADFARVGRPDVLYELAQKMNFSNKSVASDVFMSLAKRMEKGVVRKGLGGPGW